MPSQRSTYGLGVCFQGLLALIFHVSAGNTVGPMSSFLETASAIAFWLFVVGCLYGIGRVFGIYIPMVDEFYDVFPGKILSQGGSNDFQSKSITSKKGQTPPEQERHITIPWHKIFSFEFLRFIGVFLVISAVFALLFNFQWALIQKVMASAAAGLVFLGAAEFFKRYNKTGSSAVCALFSFALLQFSLTLLSLYARTQPGVLPLSPDVWLAAKFILSVAFVFTVRRYPAQLHQFLYAIIAWSSPWTLYYTGVSAGLLGDAAFMLGMTAFLLVWGGKNKQELWLINAVAAAGMASFLLKAHGSDVIGMWPAVQVLTATVSLVFLGHLSATVAYSDERDGNLARLHIAASHTLFLLLLYVISKQWPGLQDFLGIAFVATALVTFVAYLIASTRRSQATCDTLLNLSMLIASAGVFLQTKVLWSAVLFLAYACLMLWYSLYMRSLRSRVYGCVLLLVAVFKLYTTFSDIFRSIPGTLAILVIGLLLIGTSYKFEALKGLFMEGLEGSGKKE